ncbi:hypothetical protein GGH99_003952 [Coemansia sp. RSA 1285]|nr:hypothetical protein GGH99_003952 [Coemansia sp. RSA 1285]
MNKTGPNMQTGVQGAFSGQTMSGTPASISAQPTANSVVAGTAAPGKKQGSGKASSSVAGPKSKKKSQSPRTSAKARKESPKTPSALQAQSTISSSGNNNVSSGAVASVPVSVSIPASQRIAVDSPSNDTSSSAPNMNRADSISAETATKIVAEIIASVDTEEIKRLPLVSLTEQDKKMVKGYLSHIEALLGTVKKLLPVIFMCLKNAEPIKKIHTVELTVREQLRLLAVDKYIMNSANALSCHELLRKFIGIAKDWGNTMQQQELLALSAQPGARTPAPGIAAANQPNDMPQQTRNAMVGEGIRGAVVQETPLTNLHPGAMTNDPALEDFQKAVKHPLDPENLKLPAAKKRTSNKAPIAAGAQTISLASSPGSTSGMGAQLAQHPHQLNQQQPQAHASASFAPAPPILPPNISKEEFDRLPLELRTGILKEQQAALIRQHSISIGAAAPGQFLLSQPPQQGLAAGAVPGAPQANPLLMATIQGASALDVSARSAEERRLKMLEQDKWNNPLEYLMCVLDKFSKGAERAGVETSPILQQAFWPIARKSMMSSGWGVVAPDAVL